MTEPLPPPPPDLGRLSGPRKDALILWLWERLAASEEGAARLASLREMLEEAAPSSTARPATAPLTTAPAQPAGKLRRALAADPLSRARAASGTVRVRLGRGHRLWRSGVFLGLLGFLAAAFLVDAAVGWYQARALEARQQAALKLENAAFNGLYVELLRASHEPDGAYRATITLQPIGGEAPLHVMLTPLRVFVQAGLTWQEVPAREAEPGAWGVVTLDGGRDYEVIFDVAVENWAELIPGYMHVRIDSDLLISQSRAPGEDSGGDIVERKNRFYIYLKPQDADDEEIKRRSNLKGDPPVFIPMPPH